MVETFFKTLKSELVWRTVFHTRAQAKTAIARYIGRFYNPTRRHSALTSSARHSSKNAPHADNASPHLRNKSMYPPTNSRGDHHSLANVRPGAGGAIGELPTMTGPMQTYRFRWFLMREPDLSLSSAKRFGGC